MIARIWRCRTDAKRVDALLGHLQRTGIAEARSTTGYEGHLLTQRPGADADVEFTLVTFWSDMEAITRFAGEDPERARSYPSDDRYLTSADDHVTHAQVLDGELAHHPRARVSMISGSAEPRRSDVRRV